MVLDAQTLPWLLFYVFCAAAQILDVACNTLTCQVEVEELASVNLLQQQSLQQSSSATLRRSSADAGRQSGGPTPPHIVFLLVDDLGWNGFNLYGHNSEMNAPSVQDLAHGGIVLDNHYAFSSCGPSRAALMTGRVPGHGVWDETRYGATRADGVDLNMTMMPKMLKSAGYSTHHIGKWHLGFFKPAYLPVNRGFDSSFGYFNGGVNHFTTCPACTHGDDESADLKTGPTSCKPVPNYCNIRCPEDGGTDLWRDHAPATGENGTYLGDLFAKEAEDVIGSNDGTPMFLYLALSETHLPNQATEELLQQFPASDYGGEAVGRRFFNAQASSVDHTLGQVVAALKRKGMYNNTVIVLSSDNGGTYERLFTSLLGVSSVPGVSNYPLRGYKYSLFDGGAKVASVVHSPLLPEVLRGTHSSAPIHFTDWYVTFCRLAGLSECRDDSSTVALDGIDVWPLLLSNSKERPASSWAGGPRRGERVLSVNQNMHGGFITGDLKFINASNSLGTDGWSAQYPGTTQAKSIMSWDKILIGMPLVACSDWPCLFNLTSDPGEEHDLALELPDLLANLSHRFSELVQSMAIPLVWGEEDSNACKVVQQTGFWGPWQQ